MSWFFGYDLSLETVGLNCVSHMKRLSIKDLAKRSLKPFNLAMTTHSRLKDLYEGNEQNKGRAADIRFLMNSPEQHVATQLKYLAKSKAQLRQDLFVLSELGFKRNGFFVEFGATNGIELSNTHLLEVEFHWNGILAEPAKCWHSALRNNRRCHIDTNCVWNKSNAIMEFNETDIAELWTLNDYTSGDFHSGRREGKTYDVQTISLLDLLEKYDAPDRIEYLSIDTEGSEYEILKAFDFDRYQFGVITCEHNFTAEREKILGLLTSKGYARKLDDISCFDDWYVMR
jgi:FkbM family methyltransferase